MLFGAVERYRLNQNFAVEFFFRLREQMEKIIFIDSIRRTIWPIRGLDMSGPETSAGPWQWAEAEHDDVS